MNFNRDFHSSVAFKKFKRALDHHDAMEYIHRLWSHCESSRSTQIEMTDVEDLALLLDAPPELLAEKLMDAFKVSGLLTQLDDHTYESSLYATHNSRLVSKWDNGRKGGRPKETEDNQTEEKETEAKLTEEKERKKKKKKDNQTEDKGSEENERKAKLTKEKRSKVKHLVNRPITEQEPNHNRPITEQEPFKPFNWENPISVSP